jgi:hypothetical protein
MQKKQKNDWSVLGGGEIVVLQNPKILVGSTGFFH